MERRKFEDSIKQMFDAAEASPSSNVWTNIELDLEKSKGSSLRRKLIFFQLLAAASVVFAMGVGVGVYVMQRSDVQSTGIAQRVSTDSQNGSAKNEITNDAVETGTEGSQRSEADGEGTADLNQTASHSQNSIARDNSAIAKSASTSSTIRPSNSTKLNDQGFSAGNDNGLNQDEALIAFSEEGNTDLLNIVKLEDAFNLFATRAAVIPQSQAPAAIEVDPVAAMLSKLAERERALHEKESEQKKRNDREAEKLWTSVGFAAGSFNPVNPGVATSNPAMAMAQNNSIAKDEVRASGIAYSIGANVGTKLSERWVFQGGVNYLTQSSDYTAHSVVGTSDFTSFRPVSVYELNNLDAKKGEESKLVTTSPYNVNNSLRFLSIPLQAGYLVVDRDFGLQLNAGIATDVFLKNTVTAEGAANVDATTQEIGDETAYRTVNLSGIMGTEISYRFAQRYRVSLNPGLRYPFNSIYRSELAVKSTPLTFDIGLRFRYIFR